MRELQEEHTIHSRNEIIQVLDEVNTQYGLNFKLKTRNIITTPNLGGLPDEDIAKLIKLDVAPVYFNYVFDVEDIMPILKKRVEYEKTQELNRQEFLTEIKKSTNPEKVYEFIEEFLKELER